MATALDLVREYLPDLDAQTAELLLWEHTCFPIGSLSEVRKQVARFAEVARPTKRGWYRRLGMEMRRDSAEFDAQLRAISEADERARAVSQGE
jgi:hypothetical protein